MSSDIISIVITVFG